MFVLLFLSSSIFALLLLLPFSRAFEVVGPNNRVVSRSRLVRRSTLAAPPSSSSVLRDALLPPPPAAEEEEDLAVEQLMVVPATTDSSLGEEGVGNNRKRTNKANVISRERIEKAIRARPYPLFLAEKGASLLVDPLLPSSTSSSPSMSTSSSSSSSGEENKKETIVVLGTGWGAASFLKNINTDKYDVTVVSPRNYFVFTPMLAGASVGTVDFKSITEPIREVRPSCVFVFLFTTIIIIIIIIILISFFLS